VIHLRAMRFGGQVLRSFGEKRPVLRSFSVGGLLLLVLTLPGCGLTPAAWAALGAIGGATGAALRLDDDLFDFFTAKHATPAAQP
jgi:hypothetical protein